MTQIFLWKISLGIVFFMFLCFFMFCDVQALGIETEEDICKLSTYFMHIPDDRPDEHEKVGIWN